MLNQAINKTKERIAQLEQALLEEKALLARQQAKAEMFNIMQEQLLIFGQELVDEEVFTLEEVNNSLVGSLPTPPQPVEVTETTKPVEVTAVAPKLNKPVSLKTQLETKDKELKEVLEKLDNGEISKQTGAKIMLESLSFLENVLPKVTEAKSCQVPVTPDKLKV